MPTKIRLRRRSAANWASANTVLTQGEPVSETDTGRLKIGDGSTAWNSLLYLGQSLVVSPTGTQTLSSYLSNEDAGSFPCAAVFSVVDTGVDRTVELAGTGYAAEFYDNVTGYDVYACTASHAISAKGPCAFGAPDGGNYTAFDGTGHQTMVGDARPWRDQLTDALNLQQQGTGVGIDKTESTVDFVYNATYNATFTNSDAAFTNIQLNHDRDPASTILAHIHWLQAANYSPNFLLEYRWQINGGAKTTSWTKLKCNTLAHTYSSGTIHQISKAAAISPPVGTTLSDIIQFRIYRDTGNASSEFTGTCPYNTGGNRTVSVLAFDIHFQINSLGSTDEYAK